MWKKNIVDRLTNLKRRAKGDVQKAYRYEKALPRTRQVKQCKAYRLYHVKYLWCMQRNHGGLPYTFADRSSIWWHILPDKTKEDSSHTSPGMWREVCENRVSLGWAMHEPNIFLCYVVMLDLQEYRTGERIFPCTCWPKVCSPNDVTFDANLFILNLAFCRFFYYNCQPQYMDIVCYYNAVIPVDNVFLVRMVLSGF